MQMMPKINCPQRVPSEAVGRNSAAPDVVAISVPLAFVVTRDRARVAYNILRMEGPVQRQGCARPAREQARGKSPPGLTSRDGRGRRNDRVPSPASEVGPRLGPLDQPIRPPHPDLGARLHVGAADDAFGRTADIGRPRGHHLVERPAMGTEEFSGYSHSPLLGHVAPPVRSEAPPCWAAFRYYVLCIPDIRPKEKGGPVPRTEWRGFGRRLFQGGRRRPLPRRDRSAGSPAGLL